MIDFIKPFNVVARVAKPAELTLKTLLSPKHLKFGHVSAINEKTDSVLFAKAICFSSGLILGLAVGMDNIYSAAIFKGL